MVERHVASCDLGEFDGAARKAILGFVEYEIKLNGAGYSLSLIHI